MSSDQSNEKQSKINKGPLLIATAGILALAGVGGFFFTQNQDGGATSTTLSAAETTGVEEITPAAGKKNEKKAEEKAAEAAPAAVGDIKMGDPVVAKFGNEDIKRSDVFAYISTLPEQVRQMPLQDLFPLALDQVLNNKIIGQKAEQAKLESDPEVTKLLDQAKGQIVRNVYIERELTKAMSQKELLKAYEKALEGFEKVEEVHARHILLKDEAAAQEIIKKLESGTAFEDLAKESTDAQTAVNGGDLGFFAKDQMIPEFADAAFALEPGTYTKTPVKSQFGYHVIKVEEKRQRPEPQFEVVKPQLEAQVRREKLNSMLESWQKEASIKKFDINGEPVSAEPKKN
ncbi:MAG: peptidylprolyl isomerase [Micavibrio sp.]